MTMNIAEELPVDQQTLAVRFAQRIVQAEREMASREKDRKGEEQDEDESGFILSSN